MGGMVKGSSEPPPPQKKSMGGMIFGDGSRDSVPAMLTPGEFVVRKSMVDKYGKAMLTDINLGSYSLPKYSTGRPVEAKINANRQVNSISAPVYNTYDMNFNIEGNSANPDEIANRVMMKIKQVQGSSIRSNRV